MYVISLGDPKPLTHNYQFLNPFTFKFQLNPLRWINPIPDIMTTQTKNRFKYEDAELQMNDAGYELTAGTDFVCTGVTYVVDIMDDEVCVFIQPDPFQDNFGDGLNIGTLISAELVYTTDEGARYALIKVTRYLLNCVYIISVFFQ
jgi:hypothetical protein